MQVYLNPQYSIRNEKGCSYIVYKSVPVNENSKGMAGTNIVPPMIGYILSYIGSCELELAEKEISKKTQLQVDTIHQFIKKLVDNPQMIGWKYKGVTISFPPNLLVSSKENITGDIYTANDFCCTDVFTPKRPSIPLNINFMVTTKCCTNCIYCYADRNRKDDLSSQDLLRIFDEAHELGLINLTLSGGDVLAFPDWKKVIQKVSQYKFSSFLSTKVPLSRDDIFYLKDNGVIYLQISLDSIIPETLVTTLQVKRDYTVKMKQMLQYCNEAGVRVNIRTVLTKHNANKLEIGKLFTFLNTLSNINSWTFTPAFYSAFKDDYQEYRASDEDLVTVYNLTH